MWHRPQLLNALSDLLFAAGAAMLFLAATLWVLRQPLAPIRMVSLDAPLRYVNRVELEEMLQEKARGNFLNLPLKKLRESLETLPWVRRASVRRVWPNRLVISLEEQRPIANWGESGGDWVNSYGEVFSAPLPGEAQKRLSAFLPRFYGPANTAPQLAAYYGELGEGLRQVGARPVSLNLSSRLSLEMTLDTGLLLKLGRERKQAGIKERLLRFVDMYPTAVVSRQPRPNIADLRYPNGFTLYPAVMPLEREGQYE